ncbi:MAG: hypothetical protein ACHREM_20670, partial [Polyangiales bacterium]
MASSATAPAAIAIVVWKSFAIFDLRVEEELCSPHAMRWLRGRDAIAAINAGSAAPAGPSSSMSERSTVQIQNEPVAMDSFG